MLLRIIVLLLWIVPQVAQAQGQEKAVDSTQTLSPALEPVQTQVTLAKTDSGKTTLQPAQHVHNRAWDLMKSNQLDSARLVADAEVASETGKKQAFSWYSRGMIYKSIYDKDDYQENHPGEFFDLIAFDSYKTAIALDANNTLTDGILEDILSLTEDFCREGLDLFEKGYDTRNTFQLAQAAKYLDAVDEALAMLGPRQIGIHKTLQEYGIDKRMLEVCRALAKDKSGDNDDAKRIYEHLVKDKSQEPAVYLALREIYVNQKQKGKALSVLEKGLKNAPKSLELSLAYCELLADTNRASEARSLADKLAYENPNEPGPLTTQGFIEEKRQNLEKAQVYYQRAIGLDHTDFMANYRMGRLLYKEAEVSKKKEGNPQSIKELQEKSLQYAEQAALVNPKHFGNNRMLLELYNHLGQSDKAELLKTEMN